MLGAGDDCAHWTVSLPLCPPVSAGSKDKSNARAIFAGNVNERLAFDFVARSILAKDAAFGFPDALPDCRSENRTPASRYGPRPSARTDHATEARTSRSIVGVTGLWIRRKPLPLTSAMRSGAVSPVRTIAGTSELQAL